MYVCVFTCVCLCVCMCACSPSVWRPEGNLTWLSLFERLPPFLCNRVSHWPKDHRADWDDWAGSSRVLPVSILPLWGWDSKSVLPCSLLKFGFWGLNSDTYACLASILPTELSPQLQIWAISKQFNETGHMFATSDSFLKRKPIARKTKSLRTLILPLVI